MVIEEEIRIMRHFNLGFAFIACLDGWGVKGSRVEGGRVS